MNALHAKRCWSLIKGESVWAHYMLRKYGDPADPEYVMPHCPSPLWRSVVEAFPRVSSHCAWVAGRGNFPIFGVNWCGIILHKPTFLDYSPNISQVVRSPIIRLASGESADIRNFLPNKAKSMLDVMVLNNDKDRICWMLNEDGEFSTKSYWDYYRIRNTPSSWSKFYWNKFIQPRVGAFLWRLSRNAIPVDARLVSMGFQLASRCSCCANPELESIDHLFVRSETATKVWKHFAQTCLLPESPTNVDDLAQVWLHNISLSSPSGICRNIIFGNTLWEIWKQRNDILFGNGKRNCNSIISRVSAAVLHHLSAFNVSLGTHRGAVDLPWGGSGPIAEQCGACMNPTNVGAAPRRSRELLDGAVATSSHRVELRTGTADVLLGSEALLDGADAAQHQRMEHRAEADASPQRVEQWAGAAAAASLRSSRVVSPLRADAVAAASLRSSLQVSAFADFQDRARLGTDAAAARLRSTNTQDDYTVDAAQRSSVIHAHRAAAQRQSGGQAGCSATAGRVQQVGSTRQRRTAATALRIDGQPPMPAVAASQRSWAAAVAASQRGKAVQLAAAPLQHAQLSSSVQEDHQQQEADRGSTLAAAQQRGAAATAPRLHISVREHAAAAPRPRVGPRLAPLQPVAWRPPSAGLKLNIGGRCGDSSWTSGGGVIRGVNGTFIGAFLFFMEDFTVSVPEVEALLFAVNWCKTMNWSISEIETSSDRLVDIISGRKAPPWKITYKVRKIRACLTPLPVLRTVPPRANGVAKALVSFAVESKEGLIFSHPSELPPPIRSALDLDSMVT
ncbi:uncharacterized protein M6B38_366310 [Iris pallida]|uniref:Reverse transcriptase zinc-binding domain-containing protein n=1 Tax=Iris pallida TaxID=29817 RepID=A0AAX6GHR7_IRIPA|nr:uncharacterized protein M6B38_190190 [Iris pallida]KAJ6827751.1 uncharacterized protein M6B38_366310 [Iris pallida]